MLNIVIGFMILGILIFTPIVTMIIVGEILGLSAQYIGKNTALLSKICAIIIICEVIFEIFLLLYLIGRSVLI
jgi:hypothetical protein